MTPYLENIVDELELVSDDGWSFFDRLTGQLFHVGSQEMLLAERALPPDPSTPAWLQENIRIAQELRGNDRFIPLPGIADLNESGLAELFCNRVSQHSARTELRAVLSLESGWGHRFEAVVTRLDLGESWYDFKRNAFRQKAIDWCRKNGLEYR